MATRIIPLKTLITNYDAKTGRSFRLLQKKCSISTNERERQLLNDRVKVLGRFMMVKPSLRNKSRVSIITRNFSKDKISTSTKNIKIGIINKSTNTRKESFNKKSIKNRLIIFFYHGSNDSNIPAPTKKQLLRHFTISLVPFIGFGFMDQTVMIQAGNAIDCSIGVMFSLSTLSAAAFGQIVANVIGILFGGTLESLANVAGA